MTCYAHLKVSVMFVCLFVCHNIPGGTLCAQDVDNLRKWTPQAASTLSMDLTPQGYKDAYYVAQRFKSRFPSLLNLSYSPEKYEVSTQETIHVKVIWHYLIYNRDVIIKKFWEELMKPAFLSIIQFIYRSSNKWKKNNNYTIWCKIHTGRLTLNSNKVKIYIFNRKCIMSDIFQVV